MRNNDSQRIRTVCWAFAVILFLLLVQGWVTKSDERINERYDHEAK